MRTLARLVVRRKKRAKGPRAAATMTAAGRLGRLAALLLLPALVRGWDWSTNVETTFDCETHRNPIQLYKEELSVCEGAAVQSVSLSHSLPLSAPPLHLNSSSL